MGSQFSSKHTGRSADSATGDGAAEILSRYTHDQQRIILHNLEIFAASTQYVGSDYQMKVLLNRPGGGWHWNFAINEVRVDPETILKAPIDVSKAIYIHEGLHRRITPKDGVPAADWQQPGLPFLVNSIEDPRIENFGGEAYPAYRPLRDASYRYHEEQAKAAAVEKLGKIPRHVEAGLEFIKQWFREAQGLPFELAEELRPEVREFVKATLADAQDAWLRYPTRAEADRHPETIPLYFKDAYTIIHDKIWPEFQKLYELDRQEQLLDEAMRDLQGGDPAPGQPGSDPGGEPGQQPADSSAPLSEEEARQLLQAAKEGKLQLGQGNPAHARPLDLSQLSPELQKEIADFVKGLSDQKRSELQARADERLATTSKSASEALQGEAHREQPVSEAPSTDDDFEGIDLSELRRHVTISEDETNAIEAQFAEVLNQDRGPYDNTAREVSSVINELSNELRAVFEKRRKSHRETGRPSGPTLNINRFIREKASGKHPIETRAFEAKTRPLEKDYAVLLLVDVSGSMRDKIHHAFAATVACTEALTDLSIEHAIVGFNDKLYPYKPFSEAVNPDKISAIESDVHTDAARYNNDGWALLEAMKQLSAMPQKELILIVLSDGVPEPSSSYAGPAYDLKKVASTIEQSGKVRLIGLGMGPGTEHVRKFYGNNRANIPIDNLAQELSKVIKEIISS
jgi:hypothetical protein